MTVDWVAHYALDLNYVQDSFEVFVVVLAPVAPVQKVVVACASWFLEACACASFVVAVVAAAVEAS